MRGVLSQDHRLDDWHGHNNMQEPTDASDRTPHQFSLRTLFGVMLGAAILMGVAVAFRDSRYFHALWSLHALLAALPILGIYTVDVTAVVRGRRLAIISLAIYGVALATPALRLGSDLTFGFFAFLLSFVGIDLFNDWGSSGFHWYPIACTMGAVANISFIVGYGSFVTFVIWNKGIYLARWSATLGSCLALFVILPLCLSAKLNGVYIGYGFWTASLLALAFGSWRVQPIGTNNSLTIQSASRRQWSVIKLMPPQLVRFSLLSTMFYLTITVMVSILVFGFYFAIRQAGVSNVSNSILPYMLILASTAGGILICYFIWGSAARPVTNSNLDTEYLEELAPVHLQNWTYQGHRYKGRGLTMVAIAWNIIGWASLTHYAVAGWPQLSIGLMLFIPFEIAGLILIVIAVSNRKSKIPSASRKRYSTEQTEEPEPE